MNSFILALLAALLMGVGAAVYFYLSERPKSKDKKKHA